MGKYPRLTIDHNALRTNMKQVVEWCRSNSIDVAGVIKAAPGISSVALDFEASGVRWIASSRLEQLARAREEGVKLPLMMIRVPMISELEEMVEVCDFSLQSEFATIKELQSAAEAAGKVHSVILMADLGDLREGFYELAELIDVAKYIEDKCNFVYLAGIGTNLGCYGSVIPTKEKMEQLASYADAIEEVIGRPLEIVSGGATSSLIPLFDRVMPGRINQLRIGAVAACGPNEDLGKSYGRRETDILSPDAFTLEAEVIEVKTKPTKPIGKRGVDAFGRKQKYKDRGMRKRALLAIGRQDYGDIDNIKALMQGVEVIGASGDHTIVDIEDASDIIRTGDIMKFRPAYPAILYLCSSDNIKVNEVDRLYGIKI